MKSFFAAALCVSAMASSAFAGPATIRLVHWNVYHSGMGTDKVVDRSRQIPWIVAANPDVISLNEVLNTDVRDYKARLEAATGIVWYSHYAREQPDGLSVAILSKYPIV